MVTMFGQEEWTDGDPCPFADYGFGSRATRHIQTSTGTKMAELELGYGATFEQTLQLFMGLSSDEVWEIQRLLVRRVRVKLSESLSPEGMQAMQQAKEDMEEMGRRMSVSELASVTTILATTLVTECIDMGSKHTTEAPAPRRDSLDGTTRPEVQVTEKHDQSDDVVDRAGDKGHSLKDKSKIVDGSTQSVQSHSQQDVGSTEKEEIPKSNSQSVESNKRASSDDKLVHDTPETDGSSKDNSEMVHDTPETDSSSKDNSETIAVVTDSSAPAEPQGSSSPEEGESRHHTDQQDQEE